MNWIRYLHFNEFLEEIYHVYWKWKLYLCHMKNYLISWIFFSFFAGAILEEWSQCVKSMGVSSRESWAYRLTDGTSSYWQSCGTQGKHWIRLELHPDVLIHSLRIQVSRVPFMSEKLSNQNALCGNCRIFLSFRIWISDFTWKQFWWL